MLSDPSEARILGQGLFEHWRTVDEDAMTEWSNGRFDFRCEAFEALAQHIAALNALNAEDFGSVFLDDCGDPGEAGRLSYSFGAPLVETSGQASNDFESITFLDTDRALVAYATRLPPDIWVVHERRWRISTCPQ